MSDMHGDPPAPPDAPTPPQRQDAAEGRATSPLHPAAPCGAWVPAAARRATSLRCGVASLVCAATGCCALLCIALLAAQGDAASQHLQELDHLCAASAGNTQHLADSASSALRIAASLHHTSAALQASHTDATAQAYFTADATLTPAASHAFARGAFSLHSVLSYTADTATPDAGFALLDSATDPRAGTAAAKLLRAACFGTACAAAGSTPPHLALGDLFGSAGFGGVAPQVSQAVALDAGRSSAGAGGNPSQPDDTQDSLSGFPHLAGGGGGGGGTPHRRLGAFASLAAAVPLGFPSGGGGGDPALSTRHPPLLSAVSATLLRVAPLQSSSGGHRYVAVVSAFPTRVLQEVLDTHDAELTRWKGAFFVVTAVGDGGGVGGAPDPPTLPPGILLARSGGMPEAEVAGSPLHVLDSRVPSLPREVAVAAYADHITADPGLGTATTATPLSSIRAALQELRFDAEGVPVGAPEAGGDGGGGNATTPATTAAMVAAAAASADPFLRLRGEEVGFTTTSLGHRILVASVGAAGGTPWGVPLWGIWVAGSEGGVTGASPLEGVAQGHRSSLSSGVHRGVAAALAVWAAAVLAGVWFGRAASRPIAEVSSTLIRASRMDLGVAATTLQSPSGFADIRRMQRICGDLLLTLEESKHYLPQSFLEEVAACDDGGGAGGKPEDAYALSPRRRGTPPPLAAEELQPPPAEIGDVFADDMDDYDGAGADGGDSERRSSAASSDISSPSADRNSWGSSKSGGRSGGSLHSDLGVPLPGLLLSGKSAAGGASFRRVGGTPDEKPLSDNIIDICLDDGGGGGGAGGGGVDYRKPPRVLSNLGGKRRALACPLSRKTCACVVVGMRDFHQKIRCLGDAQAVLELHTIWIQTALTDMRAFGGNVERFVADAVFVNFGGLTPCLQAAAKAARYALAVRERHYATIHFATSSDTDPAIGIAVGPALVGTLGGDGLKGPAVIGRAAIVAQAMQGIAREMGIDVVSDSRAAEDLQGMFAVVPVDYVKLGEAGKKEFAFCVCRAASDIGAEWMYNFGASSALDSLVRSVKNIGEPDGPTLPSVIEQLHAFPDEPLAKIIAARFKFYLDEVLVLSGRPPADYCRMCRVKPLTVAAPEAWRKLGAVLGGCALGRVSRSESCMLGEDPRSASLGSFGSENSGKASDSAKRQASGSMSQGKKNVRSPLARGSSNGGAVAQRVKASNVSDAMSRVSSSVRGSKRQSNGSQSTQGSLLSQSNPSLGSMTEAKIAGEKSL